MGSTTGLNTPNNTGGQRLVTLEGLLNVIRKHPIIDNHAHNLLRATELHKYAFESITSEAQGPALEDTYKSLPHLRAATQLKELYEVDHENWDAIKSAREEWLQRQPDELFRRCFEGVHTILMDDGLDAETVEDYTWHDSFTTSQTKRIVRIETVAEKIIQSILNAQGNPIHTWAEGQRAAGFLRHFKSVFMAEIQASVADSNVVGFKSVICYRTGLDVQTREESDPQSGYPVVAFQAYIHDLAKTNSFRLNHKALNDWILSIAMQGILSSAKSKIKPIQFHTGLGDNDMSLKKSNPNYLQDLIEYFPEVPIVLLHASYPYTREAGYLACVFKNVYLDVGEVFPMISREGQLRVLNQALELVPGNKLLWSTDGHWFPETYWLAIKQFRSALETVLTSYVTNGDFTIAQATDLAKDIMFNNSNRLYKLDLDSGFRNPSLSPFASNSRENLLREPALIQGTGANSIDVPTSLTLSLSDPVLDFVYLLWIDYMGTQRARMLPIKQFRKVINGEAKLGMSRGNSGTLQNDTFTPAVNTTGQIFLEPDMRTFRETHKGDTLRVPQTSGRQRESKTATVLAYWRDDLGSPLPSCPRGNLDAILNTLETEYNIQPLVGFEVEVTFLSRDTTTSPASHTPYTVNHAWGTLTTEQWAALPLLRHIVTQLDAMGIEIEQFHAESGPGQFELILPPATPLAAVDTLIQARTAIQQIAHAHHLRATFHPSPYGPNSAGSGAHAHISLNGPSSTEHVDATFFVGGVLRHIAAVCAFSLPELVSYNRVVDGSWTGGTWVAWGTQNRETPLRRVRPDRWEVRCLDGMANMYIAITAIFAAGLLGLRAGSGAITTTISATTGGGSDHSNKDDGDHEDEVFHEAQDSAGSAPSPLPPPQDTPWLAPRDCERNPSHLTSSERAEYNICERMPRKLEEALEALHRDAELTRLLGETFVGDFLAMKKVEIKMLRDMDEDVRRDWEIQRY